MEFEPADAWALEAEASNLILQAGSHLEGLQGGLQAPKERPGSQVLEFVEHGGGQGINRNSQPTLPRSDPRRLISGHGGSFQATQTSALIW